MSEVIKFTIFDNGKFLPKEGSLAVLEDKFVVVECEGKTIRFRRNPGSRSGYATGAESNYRLNLEEREKYCLKDTGRR